MNKTTDVVIKLLKRTPDGGILQWARPIGYIQLYVWGWVAFAMALVLFFAMSEKYTIIVGVLSLAVGVFASVLLLNNAKEARNLYKTIDTFRDLMIEKNVRSLSDFSKSSNLEYGEIVEDLKMLQSFGYLRQFSINRKENRFVEYANWIEGSNEFKKITFVCPSCGANNSVYTESNSSTASCEYCGSSSNILI
jgi:hypothetical protein